MKKHKKNNRKKKLKKYRANNDRLLETNINHLKNLEKQFKERN
jgi:hypothetical protein